MRRGFASTAVVLMLACSPGESGPPEIAYGLEECAYCRMIISEEAHAAAVAGTGGRVWKFDDLGCLLEVRSEWQGEGSRVWVHDAESAAWLDASEAVFVRLDASSTPMGSGLVALATRQEARRRGVAAESIYDWPELVSSDVALDGPQHEVDEEEMRQ